MKLLIRWAISSIAIFAAAQLIPGIRVENMQAWTIYAIMAILLGLVNAFVRPFLKLLSCPLIILTLGLFVLVINAISLMLAAWLASLFKVGFYVDNFGAALLGSLVISVVTVFFNLLIKDEEKKSRKKEPTALP